MKLTFKVPLQLLLLLCSIATALKLLTTSSTPKALAMEVNTKGGGWGGVQQDEGGRWVGRKKGVGGLGLGLGLGFRV